jgi:predicted transcriptional regulator
MARPKSKNLTDAEHRIMHVLWNADEASVREITDHLAKEHNLAYTTILTTTRILVDKGYVGFRKSGRSHMFKAILSQDQARSGALKTVLGNLFNGSPRLLAQHLIEAEDFSDDDIKALRALLDGDKHDQ